MLIRSKTPTPGPAGSQADLRPAAFHRNGQALLRQLGMLLLFGLSLLNTLLWQGVPLSWVMADIGLTLLAGTWVLSRYVVLTSKAKTQPNQTR